jgi:hypothetical protein
VRIEKTSDPAFGSLAPLAPMRLPSHKPGRYFRFCSSVPYWRAVAQPFHHGNRRDGVRAAPAEFFGNRQTVHAESGAFFPSIVREDPLSVAFNHAAAQFGAGKIDRCLL